MVEVIDINNEKGIYVLECEMDEGIDAVNRLRSIYPNALLESGGYKSGKWIIHLHENWDKYLSKKVSEDGREYKCVNCPDCDGKPSFRDNGRCFGEQFWSEVVEEKERHFVEDNEIVLSFTFGEGGFGNRRYKIVLNDNEVLEDVGLWHRGELPKNLENVIQKGKRF